MPSEQLIRRFEDILDNISRIERFTADLDFSSFVADEQVLFAVLHALLIISESARKLAKAAETLAPGQPWRSIRSLGNILRHAYDDVEPEPIWRIVRDELPGLKAAVEQALMHLRGGPE